MQIAENYLGQNSCEPAFRVCSLWTPERSELLCSCVGWTATTDWFIKKYGTRSSRRNWTRIWRSMEKQFLPFQGEYPVSVHDKTGKLDAAWRIYGNGEWSKDNIQICVFTSSRTWSKVSLNKIIVDELKHHFNSKWTLVETEIPNPIVMSPKLRYIGAGGSAMWFVVPGGHSWPWLFFLLRSSSATSCCSCVLNGRCNVQMQVCPTPVIQTTE